MYLQPVHLLVGRAWEREKVSLLSALWRQRHKGPHGEIRLLFMGVAQLAWQNSMQMYWKCMIRKLSFHSHTGRVQEVASAAHVVTAIEMWEPTIQHGIVNPSIPLVMSQVSHQIMQFLSTNLTTSRCYQHEREGSGMPEMTLGRLQVSQRETC